MLLLTQGLLPVAVVYLTRSMVDRLAAAIGAGATWDSLRPLAVLAALLAGTILLIDLLRGVTGWVRTAQAELLTDHVTNLIHRQSLAADLAFYEWPDYYDHLHRARGEAGYRPVALLESMGSLLQNGITLFAMGVVLIPYGLWLPVVLLASTLPALCVVLHFTLRQHQWRLRTTPDERRTWYYDWVLTTGETAAEVRAGRPFPGALPGAAPAAPSRAVADGEASSGGRAGRRRCRHPGHGRRHGVDDLAGPEGTGDPRRPGSVLPGVPPGPAPDAHPSSEHGPALCQQPVPGQSLRVPGLEPKVIDPDHPLPLPNILNEGIRFDQVAFRYPGSPRRALEDFSLTIPAGQLVALVGPNGAGKSTLVKLLCRFYDPEAGRITLDGIDLRDLSLEELRSRITVLFQTPVHYNATVAENIALGDLNRGLGPVIQATARAAGADETIACLPRGYDQLLGNWFESGTELSVGEWQRIALARAFLRQAPIIALDEPTSAMDPWAEADWLGLPFARRRPDLHLHHPPLHDGHACGYHPRHGRRPDRGIGLSRAAPDMRRPLRRIVGHADPRIRPIMSEPGRPALENPPTPELWRAPISSRLMGSRMEIELLLDASRAHLEDDDAERLRARIRGDLDWDDVLRLARRNRVTPLLYRSLKAVGPGNVPPEVFDRLQGAFREISASNLRMTGELIGLLDLFGDHGIAAIPYKGPTLAALAYGNLAFREFSDLDLLLHERDLAKARGLLTALGFRLGSSLTSAQEVAYVTSIRELPLVSPEGILVELHVEINPRDYGFPLDLDRLEERLLSRPPRRQERSDVLR